MIDCDKCVYRKNGKCGYKKEGCNYIPVNEPVIPISVIEQIKADIENISETEPITDGITIYGVQYRTGASVKNEILELIDRHIKEYTE